MKVNESNKMKVSGEGEMMQEVSEEKAIKTALPIKAFVLGVGIVEIGVAAFLIPGMIKDIQTQGYAVLDMVGEKQALVTGFLVGGNVNAEKFNS